MILILEGTIKFVTPQHLYEISLATVAQTNSLSSIYSALHSVITVFPLGFLIPLFSSMLIFLSQVWVFTMKQGYS